MHLYLQGNDFHFELENVCRLFLPLEKVITHHEESVVVDGLTVECAMEQDGAQMALRCRVRLDGFDEELTSAVSADSATLLDDCELELCTLLYHLLVKLLGFTHGSCLIPSMSGR